MRQELRRQARVVPMIKNEHQYGVTRSRVKKFDAAVARMDLDLARAGDRLQAVERVGLESKADEMRRDIAEYEALRSGRMPAVDADDPECLPRQLIKARIALGMTQRELAERAGMPEWRVGEYERTDYESAGYAQLMEVHDALLPGAAQGAVHGDGPHVDRVLSRIKAAGLEGGFVDECILGRSYARGECVEEVTYERKLLSRLRRIYGWTPGLLLGDAPLCAAPVKATTGLPAGADPAAVRAHAVYAGHVAGILARASGGGRRPRPRPVRRDPRRLREDIQGDKNEPITLTRLVEYAWSAGIAVGCLPPLAFPAAYFGGEGSGTIVLARRGASESKLMLDVARGLYHAGRGRDGIDFDGRGAGAEGSGADEFAHAVLVGPGADGMFGACIDRCAQGADARGPAMLARAASEVAMAGGARPDSLADYMAHRLAGETSLDWRGAAREVRVEVPEWRHIVASAVAPHVDLVGLSNPDFELLFDVMGVRM